MNNTQNAAVAVLKNRKTTLPIFNLPTVLGRNDQAVDIYLYHESVSREHCMFELLEGMFTVKDLGSTAGTFINGGRLEPGIPYQLEPGSKLKIGKVKFTVEINQDELLRIAQEGFAAAQQPGIAAQEGIAPDPFPNEEVAPAQQPAEDAPAEDSVPGQRRIAVDVREVGEYEYDESEVVYINCGIGSEAKAGIDSGSEVPEDPEIPEIPESPDDIKNIEAIEDAPVDEDSIDEHEADIHEPDIKETQSMDMEEAEEAIAEAEEEVISNLLEADDESTVILSVSQAVQPEETEASEETEAMEEPKKTTLSWIDDESGEIMRLIIDRYPFSIGRKSEENDYVIRRKGISRKHMTFDIIEGDVCICDENSTNGVRVSGEKLEPGEFTELRSGDGIRAGGITFAVKIED